MPDYFRAVALDFDGTLTDGERPAPAVLAALGEARAGGRRLVLVTGRTLRHLRAGFADVDNWFDAIVAENGAVLHTQEGSQVLAQPIDPALADALARRGVQVDRGQVLLGCSATHDHLVLEEVRRLGADYQLTRNSRAHRNRPTLPAPPPAPKPLGPAYWPGSSPAPLDPAPP
ncbi:hypothetical protein TESS_TESS_01850 [Tessaracoccus sp. O5.2]|uniref:HAD family hydrolase n=1 Tax=Tessaracoccus sp. O5.2 TaxID=3157622 RepID=UPI0035EAA915